MVAIASRWLGERRLVSTNLADIETHACSNICTTPLHTCCICPSYSVLTYTVVQGEVLGSSLQDKVKNTYGLELELGHRSSAFFPTTSNTFLTMRLSRAPPTLISLLAVILSSHHTVQAKPFLPSQELKDGQNSTLEERGCANPCGWTGQLCCAADQACYTSAGQAACGAVTAAQQAVAASGQWQYYTTTYVQTDLITVTSIFSSFVGQATTTVVQAPAPTTVFAPVTTTALGCNTALNEKPCGSICCAAGQVCQYQGQCGAAVNSDASSAYFYSSVVAASSVSPYIRPTSATTQTITSIGSATTTVAFQTPVASDGSNNNGTVIASTNNGLSGGAIAGIVIGVLLGLFLLFLLCAAFCFRELFNGLLAIFGLGPRTRRRRTEETYIEERHSHRASGGAVGGRRTWYGASLPAKPSRPAKRSSGWGGAAAVGAGLGTLALLLGLRRKREQRNEKESYGSGSSYTYSDYTSASK